MFEIAQDIYSLLSRPYVLIILAFTLDLSIGDPRWLPHPVRFMGVAINKIETFLREFKIVQNGSRWFKNALALRSAGVVLVVIMVGSTYGLFYLINSMLLTTHSSSLTSYLLLFVIIYLTGTTLALRGLIDSAKAVLEAVANKDLKGSRDKVSNIVGRDTDTLDEKGILRATIESLAENASDGIIAPMFYFAIGGLPLAMVYKAINTMDSMIGYKNAQYRHFGWAAARLDDIANYIPARITGILIVIASSIVCRSLITVHCSLSTMLRDGRKHLSPNSGVPEAAMAGALGVRLGGPSRYEGILVDRPYIGEERIEGSPYLKAAETAISITRATSVLGLLIAVISIFIRIGL